ncbi:MAG: transposase [bacterium]
MESNTMQQTRKNIRLPGYDYSQNGFYFVTICTQNRENVFGDIVDGKMVLNNVGRVVNQTIRETPKIRKNVKIDIHQIMPNHVHIIIIITGRVHGVGAYCNTPQQLDNTPHFRSPTQTLGSIVRGIKSVTTRQIRIIMGNPEFLVWQRNYHEHIIRNEIEYLKIKKYIQQNPIMWERDRNNPKIISNNSVDFEALRQDEFQSGDGGLSSDRRSP